MLKKMKIRYKIFGFLLFISFGLVFQAKSQEYLTGLKENTQIKKFLKQKGSFPKVKSGSTYLQLPFFDDFSEKSIFPDQTNWSDYSVYINNTQASSPLSLGVATFDAIDSSGMIYEYANTKSFEADFLTSREIDLEYPATDNIYLSFYYQAQGIMDIPEENDSLTLEFYAPEEEIWYNQWSIPGDSVKEFRAVIQQITDSIFLKKGFKFRFKNYASITDSRDASLISNADHWHIDYVYLNKNRTENDTIPQDICFTNPPVLSLKNYSSIPWKHFLENGSSEMDNIFEIEYQNNSVNAVGINLEMEINDLRKMEILYSRELGSDNLSSYENKTMLKTFNYTYYSTEADSAVFELKSYFTQSQDSFPTNDTCRSNQIFYNYYSYDDGNPENGYGLSGSGTRNALLAYQFHNYKTKDSLRAVQMYFNQSFENASQKYFTITIWNDNDGVPGDVIYSQIGVIPVYNGLNEFHNYLLDTAKVVPETYYVGWQQTTPDLLNIGFDKSRDVSDKIFYNIYGYWSNTSFSGALMMRPVFSLNALKKGVKDIEIEDEKEIFGIYPNPANNVLHVKLQGESEQSDLQISIIDINGRTVFQTKEYVNEINLGKFRNGIYFIKLTNSKQLTDIKKIIISR